ncbi:hypothetical protein B0A49_01320 [Cryomyces minteri]|uniref:Disease resistance R13L4/SHOC-2-like LRR domain-containing protein n=1 Tax=Cryomyces minteri TaxID=331657 RepID=A0A4U0XTS3_9PEZI|nr:hypothetical protein B0A49_01320 [Cryomyces minteri]
MADLDFVPAAVADDLVGLARNELARERGAHYPASSDTDASQEHPNGVTIDLGYRKIQTLPAEMIDVIKDECARLALSHNLLTSLPPQLSKCTRLRYLNVRSNSLREFPEAILQLSSLEILDISKNKIRVLPPEISNLKSLKVFSIQKTRIEQLPVGLADINSLQVLKLYGLPLTFPPPDICTLKKDTPIPADEN